MGQNIPNTLDGALFLGVSAFVLAFVLASILGLIVAALPLINRLGSAVTATIGSQPASALEQAGAEDHPIAAISAAVATIIGPHRIVRIEPAHGLEWQAEGRAAQHGSHAFSHTGSSQRHPDKQGNSNGT
jgi:hypothetical protein